VLAAAPAPAAAPVAAPAVAPAVAPVNAAFAPAPVFTFSPAAPAFVPTVAVEGAGAMPPALSWTTTFNVTDGGASGAQAPPAKRLRSVAEAEPAAEPEVEDGMKEAVEEGAEGAEAAEPEVQAEDDGDTMATAGEPLVGSKRKAAFVTEGVVTDAAEGAVTGAEPEASSAAGGAVAADGVAEDEAAAAAELDADLGDDVGLDE